MAHRIDLDELAAHDPFPGASTESIPVGEHLAVTRVVVIGDAGKEFAGWDLWQHGVELQLQDDGRTLKVFPRQS